MQKIADLKEVEGYIECYDLWFFDAERFFSSFRNQSEIWGSWIYFTKHNVESLFFPGAKPSHPPKGEIFFFKDVESRGEKRVCVGDCQNPVTVGK